MLPLLFACTEPPVHRKILWISMDTVGAEQLSLYDGPVALPALESMGGRVYEHAFSHFPETAVSHWTMLTGTLPDVHGDVPRYGGSAYTGATLAEHARSDGYATAAFIGGITLKSAASGLGRGFDVYDDRFAGETRPAPEVAAAAIRWIEEQNGDWFAFVHFFDAHFPYEPKDPAHRDPTYTGPYDGTDRTLRGHRDHAEPLPADALAHIKKLYQGEISELQGPLQSLLATLEGTEVVVVTADHGESFGHGYYFNHRASVYDEVLHVPLVIRAPALPPGRDSRLVGLSDVMPMVLPLAGMSLPEPIVGAMDVERTTLGSHTDAFMPPWSFSMRSATQKVIWGEGAPIGFNLATDPHELTPVQPDPTLLAAREAYRLAVSGMRRWTKPLGAPRDIAAEERARLESLGYLVPQP